MTLFQVGPGAGVGGSSSVSRVTSRQSSTCSTIAQGGPRLLGVHGRSGTSGRGSVNSTPCLSRDNSRNSASGSGPAPGSNGQTSMMVQTSFDSGAHGHTGKRGEAGDRVSNEAGAGHKKTGQPTPLVTVINTDNETSAAGAKQQQQQQPSGSGASNAAGAFLGSRGPGLCMTISGAPSPRQLSRQGSSIESSTVHTHTVECAGSLASARLHQPVTSHTRGSPTSNECDFHCCSLHAGHANHQSTHKNIAATSPVQVSSEHRINVIIKLFLSLKFFFSILRNLMSEQGWTSFCVQFSSVVKFCSESKFADIKNKIWKYGYLSRTHLIFSVAAF